MNRAEEEIARLRAGLGLIAESKGNNIDVDGVIYGPSMYAAKVLGLIGSPDAETSEATQTTGRAE